MFKPMQLLANSKTVRETHVNQHNSNITISNDQKQPPNVCKLIVMCIRQLMKSNSKFLASRISLGRIYKNVLCYSQQTVQNRTWCLPCLFPLTVL